MKYLLDTCVISELVSKTPRIKVVEWIDGLEDERVFLSVITIGEIKKGLEMLSDSNRKRALEAWLNDELLIRFQGRILPVDLEVVLTWGQLMGRLDLAGQKMPAVDALIAATALRWNLELATRNESDFLRAGVSILNPWD